VPGGVLRREADDRRGAAAPAPGALLDAPVVLTSNGSTSQLAANGAGEAIAIYYEGSGTTIGSEAFYAITSRAFEDPAAGAAIVKPVIGGGSQPAVTLPQAGGAVGLPVTCPADCTLVPDGILATNGRGVAHSAAAGKRRLARKRRTMVRVRFTKAQMRSARRALRSGKRASVSYTVTVRRRGSATPLSFSRRIRLKLR
jgi:hypothetical protein